MPLCILMTTERALQNTLAIPPFTHTFMQCIYVQHFLSHTSCIAFRGNLGFSNSSKDTWSRGLKETGIETQTLRLVEDYINTFCTVFVDRS